MNFLERVRGEEENRIDQIFKKANRALDVGDVDTAKSGLAEAKFNIDTYSRPAEPDKFRDQKRQVQKLEKRLFS